jgi:purine-binding chemotaxis protein CheW
MILDHCKIFDFEEEISEEELESRLQNPRFDELTSEERKIFHDRAVNLMQSVVKEDPIWLMPVAVISLGKEFFGMGLELVSEFTDMRGYAPVPCCPQHIIGNMNLRGNILTLIDLRRMLNLPSGKLPETAKVVVAGMEDMLVGITVDDVLDVVYLKQSDISHVPSAIPAMREEYLRGNAPYAGRMMTLLNLARILTANELIVNQEA